MNEAMKACVPTLDFLKDEAVKYHDLAGAALSAGVAGGEGTTFGDFKRMKELAAAYVQVRNIMLRMMPTEDPAVCAWLAERRIDPSALPYPKKD